MRVKRYYSDRLLGNVMPDDTIIKATIQRAFVGSVIILCVFGCPTQPQSPRPAIERITQAMRTSCVGGVDGLPLADAQIATILIDVETLRDAGASKLQVLSASRGRCDNDCIAFEALLCPDDDNVPCEQRIEVCTGTCNNCFSAVIEYAFRNE